MEPDPHQPATAATERPPEETPETLKHVYRKIGPPEVQERYERAMNDIARRLGPNARLITR